MYEADKCDGCGHPLMLTTREDVDWNIEFDTVCRHCASRAIAHRAEDKAHEKDKPAKPGQPEWFDGRMVTGTPVYSKRGGAANG